MAENKKKKKSELKGTVEWEIGNIWTKVRGEVSGTGGEAGIDRKERMGLFTGPTAEGSACA